MIQPTFDVDDTVFVASAKSRQVTYKCPDCVGEKMWQVKTPAGETFAIACPTCARGFEGSSGYLTRWERSPIVTAMIVGSVRVDTNNDDPVSYMMLETGVGSGRIHYSATVFASRDEAKPLAELLCAEGNAADEVRAEELRQRNRKNVRRIARYVDFDDLRRACLMHGGQAIWTELTGLKRLQATASVSGSDASMGA